MKLSSFLNQSMILLIVIGFLYACSGTESTEGNEVSGTTSAAMDTPANPLEGGWLSVWGKYGDNIRNPEKPYQIKVFTDKHFSLLMDQGDSTWVGWAGTYVLEGNLFKETMLYTTDSNLPEWIGTTIWWTYEIEEDTLWMTGPEKVINKDGEEMPDAMGGYGHMKEARVRAK
jgi:hypothetical protein